MLGEGERRWWVDLRHKQHLTFDHFSFFLHANEFCIRAYMQIFTGASTRAALDTEGY